MLALHDILLMLKCMIQPDVSTTWHPTDAEMYDTTGCQHHLTSYWYWNVWYNQTLAPPDVLLMLKCMIQPDVSTTWSPTDAEMYDTTGCQYHLTAPPDVLLMPKCMIQLDVSTTWRSTDAEKCKIQPDVSTTWRPTDAEMYDTTGC
jgi:hypothetical protein